MAELFCLTHILFAAAAVKELSIRESLTEFCVAELEEVSGESTGVHHFNAAGFSVGLGFPQPIVQESSHPYTDDVTLTGSKIFYRMARQ